MKPIKNILPAFVLCALLFTACTKWFEVKPATSVLEKDLFSSEEGYHQALSGVYVMMGSENLYGGQLTLSMLDVLAQNYQTLGFGHLFLELGKYNYSNAAMKGRINLIWTDMYQAIGQINNILTNIDENKSLFSKGNYELVKGELLGLRALMHFDLLRMYGPLNSIVNTAAFMPYVVTYNNKTTPLSNGTQVINASLKDLDEAETLMVADSLVLLGGSYDNNNEIVIDKFRNYSQSRINSFAINALKARIHLYANNTAEAYKYAKKIIDAKKFAFVTSSSFSSSTDKDRTFSKEHIFGLHVPKLKATADDFFKIEGKTSTARLLFLSQANMDELYEISKGGSTDFRYRYLIRTTSGNSYTMKYWQEEVSSEQYKNRVPIIKLAEMYYIAAETTQDPVESLTLLQTIRANRGLLPLTETELSGDKLREALDREYNKEFYAEGQLWYYYKRLGKTIIPRLTTALTPQNYEFPIPENEIEFGNR